MASLPPEQWQGGGGGVGSDEISIIFCDHVNFSEMNGAEGSVYEGMGDKIVKSYIIKSGVSYH